MKLLENTNFDIKGSIFWTVTILAMFIWIPFIWGVSTAFLGVLFFFWNEEIQNFIFMNISLLPLIIYGYIFENLIPDWLDWLVHILTIICFICLFLFFFIASTGIGNSGWGRDDGGGDGG